MTNNKLQGKRIVITRPINRSKVLAELIEDNGGTAIIVPTLELQLVKSPELIEIAENIDDYDWIIFTSPAGVKSFFNVYEGSEISSKIAVIGVKTEEILNKYGYKPDIIPETFTAEGLLEAFEDIDINDNHIALPRTLSARKVLPEGLEALGANVQVAESYKSTIPKDTSSIMQLADSIMDNDVDVITFTSPLTVKNFLDVIKMDDEEKYEKVLNKLKDDIIVLSIGPITGNMLKEYDLDAIQPDRYTVKDMINTLIENI